MVWTGTELIVWGGTDPAVGCSADGARYDPTTSAWSPLPPAPLAPRMGATAVWTGTEFIVWGGCCKDKCFADGARYRP